MRNPYVAGTYVYLRHPTMQDCEGPWHEWLSDEETTRWLSHRHWPNSLEKQMEFYGSCLNTKDRLVLAIVDVATDKHIGVCSLSGINWVHRYCDVAIIIGDKDYRNGKYMFEAMSLLLQTAFLRLNMRVVKSSHAASNSASQAIHDVFRFEEAGRLTNLLWDRGAYVDEVISMLTADKWIERNGL